MNIRNSHPLASVLVLAIFVVGCSQGSPSGEAAVGAEGSGAQTTALTPTRTGAQIWAENCNRCHNIRPPQSFSAAQWQTIVHHMRIRANLTGQEARAVTVFLQSNNQ